MKQKIIITKEELQKLFPKMNILDFQVEFVNKMLEHQRLNKGPLSKQTEEILEKIKKHHKQYDGLNSSQIIYDEFHTK